MKKTNFRRIGAIALALTLTAGVTACGSDTPSISNTNSVSVSSQASADNTSVDNTSETKDGVRVIKAGRVFASPPYNYNDENGNQTGFETEVVKAAFDLLDQYELVFEDTTDTDIWTGVQTGKYDLAFKTAWYTDERAEKFYVSGESTAVTTVGLLYRTENADQIHDFASFAAFSGKLVPLSPSNAQYTVVQKWNENNPDSQIDLQATDSFDAGEAITWLLEGRYDGHIYTGHYYKNNVVSETGAYHDYNDKLSFAIYSAFPTYAYFNKENPENEALVAAFDGALKQLQENGTILELEQQFFGEDLYQYIDELAQLH